MLSTFYRTAGQKQPIGGYVRLAVAFIATVYFLYYSQTPHEWHFIDNVNLIFHEAGHVVFSPFGDFMHILGGSLFQVMFPLVYIFYFWWKQNYFSASLLLFWVGQNLINVSVYASDAIAMQLPLLGGDSSNHDWHFILSYLNLLPYTPQVGYGLYLSGVLIIAAAAVLSFITARSGD